MEEYLCGPPRCMYAHRKCATVRKSSETRSTCCYTRPIVPSCVQHIPHTADAVPIRAHSYARVCHRNVFLLPTPYRLWARWKRTAFVSEGTASVQRTWLIRSERQRKSVQYADDFATCSNKELAEDAYKKLLSLIGVFAILLLSRLWAFLGFIH